MRGIVEVKINAAHEFQIENVVYKRPFNLSCGVKWYNTKQERKFVKAQVISRIGTVETELEGMGGRNLAVAQAKDLKLDLQLSFV